MTSKEFCRPDGRNFDQCRPLSFVPNYVPYAEGSVLVNWGDTRVLCNMTIQEGVPAWLAGQGRGWLTAEYAMLPRSTISRSPRETHGLKGRTQEIRRFIGRALRMAVDLCKIGERTLLLDCDVIQADGGTRVASVTGGYVALALALKPLIEAGVLPAESLHPPIAAVSVGVVQGQPILDLNYAEDSQAEVDLNVVMTADGQFIEVQGTAESKPFSPKMLEKMLSLAQGMLQDIITLQKKVIHETQ